MNSALTCLLLFSTTLALGESKDVNGWDKIKWGMTLEQAAAAYNIEYKPEKNEYWTILDLPSITVAGINLGVNCGAKLGTDSITLVRMSDWGNPSPGNRDTIKTLLIQKYGQPNSQDENSVLWVLSSTSITMEVNRFGWVSIIYKAIEKNSL